MVEEQVTQVRAMLLHPERMLSGRCLQLKETVDADVASAFGSGPLEGQDARQLLEDLSIRGIELRHWALIMTVIY